MIRFSFEIIKKNWIGNFTNCKDLNISGIRRFTPTPLINDLKFYSKRKIINNDIRYIQKEFLPEESKYIISSGVMHAPDFWAGEIPLIGDKTNFSIFNPNLKNKKNSRNKNLFLFLNKNYLNDLQNKKAYLLLDQTHEGYQEQWLWDWFHKSCNEYKISPKQIIFLTGNLKSKNQYKTWCKNNIIKERIKIIPYAHFELAISKSLEAKENILPSFSDHIEYKEKNKESIKLYNCLQKRPRSHRIWFFNKLRENDLLKDGINSMNKFINVSFEGISLSLNDYDACMSLLPMLPPNDNNYMSFVDQDCGEYLSKITE